MGWEIALGVLLGLAVCGGGAVALVVWLAWRDAEETLVSEIETSGWPAGAGPEAGDILLVPRTGEQLEVLDASEGGRTLTVARTTVARRE